MYEVLTFNFLKVYVIDIVSCYKFFSSYHHKKIKVGRDVGLPWGLRW